MESDVWPWTDEAMTELDIWQLKDLNQNEWFIVKRISFGWGNPQLLRHSLAAPASSADVQGSECLL